MEQTKKWWQSKIVLLSIAFASVFITDFSTNFLTGQGVTPEQMQEIAIQYPEIATQVQALASGANWMTVLGAIFPIVVAILRVWFTNKKIKIPANQA